MCKENESNKNNLYSNNLSNNFKRSEKVRISQPDIVIVDEGGRSPYGSGTPDNVERAMNMPYYNRYDIVLADFGNDYEHCLTCEIRPAIVISPTEYCARSPILLTIPMTKHFKFIDMECHLFIDKEDCEGLTDSGMALGEQIRCIDRTQVKRKIGMITDERLIEKLDKALAAAVGIR
ncbi:MAG: type II toxin-antitoxin system PemK/MazF family toxin [Candidatus Methanofastidiosa archaeon]|nr:type II toxin-antitoxin system PemK/MazF family toxin [Candidatus Methanofastidiosa archaeon]